jgi:hypothetical protein
VHAVHAVEESHVRRDRRVVVEDPDVTFRRRVQIERRRSQPPYNQLGHAS